MMCLFVTDETFTNGFNYNIIRVIDTLSILSGIFVIVSKNSIISLLFLISLFLNIACYLMMLGMSFIGLSYLLVYVGAVSILFLFILMLINVRISELTSINNNGIPLALLSGIPYNLIFYRILPQNSSYYQENIMEEKSSSVNVSYPINYDITLLKDTDLSFVTSQIWDGLLSESSHITMIGNVLYTCYPLLLILTSLILLLAMVGAIVITIK